MEGKTRLLNFNFTNELREVKKYLAETWLFKIGKLFSMKANKHGKSVDDVMTTSSLEGVKSF